MKRLITAISASGIFFFKASAESNKTKESDLFHTLAKQYSVTADGVTLISGNCGRGVFATHEILAGETIFAVPSNLCIQEDQLEGDVIFWSAIQLMKKLSTDEFWMNYKMLLPSPAEVPFELDEEVLSQISDPAISSSIRNLKREAHEKLQNILKEKASLVQATFDWAYALILSRAFGLRCNDGGKHEVAYALVPFIDMVNHSSTNHNAEVSVERWSICLKSTRDIKESEEVFIQYTPGPNAAFFLKYGFIETDNPEDIIIFDEDVEVDVGLFSEFLLQNNDLFKEENTLQMLKMVKSDENNRGNELQRVVRTLKRLDRHGNSELELPGFVHRYELWYTKKVSMLRKILSRYVLWLETEIEKS